MAFLEKKLNGDLGIYYTISSFKNYDYVSLQLPLSIFV